MKPYLECSQEWEDSCGTKKNSIAAGVSGQVLKNVKIKVSKKAQEQIFKILNF